MATTSIARIAAAPASRTALSAGSRSAAPVAARAPRGAALRVRAKAPETEDEGRIVSGEWAVNWSLSSYEDCSAYYEDKIFHEKVEGGMRVGEIMTTAVTVAYVNQNRWDLEGPFSNFTGLPVVDDNMILRGVISKKDLLREGDSVEALMSSPAVFAKPNQVVAEIVCMMFRNKIWRIPVVNDDLQVVGLVTRTDVFTAVALENAVPLIENGAEPDF